MNAGVLATSLLIGSTAHAQPIPEFASMAFCGRADIIEPAAVGTCECMEAQSLKVLQRDWDGFDAARRDACQRAEARVNLRSYFHLLKCIGPAREPMMHCFAN